MTGTVALPTIVVRPSDASEDNPVGLGAEAAALSAEGFNFFAERALPFLVDGLEGLSTAAPVVGVVADTVIEAYEGYEVGGLGGAIVGAENGLINGFSAVLGAQAGAEVFTVISGLIASAETGAEVGALVGTAVEPGFGTIIGGVLGAAAAVTGGLGGYYLGKFYLDRDIPGSGQATQPSMVDPFLQEIAQQYLDPNFISAQSILSSDFNALGSNNGLLSEIQLPTPNGYSLPDSQGFPSDSAPNLNASDVISTDFSAMNAPILNANNVVAPDFGALGLNAGDIVTSDFNALNLGANSIVASLPADVMPNALPANDVQPVGDIEANAYQAAIYNPTIELPSTIDPGIPDIPSPPDNPPPEPEPFPIPYYYYPPIVLDVAGVLGVPDGGIKITPLSSSDTFFDMAGSGHQNLTAWAGAGNGVLFFDPTGHGQLTQEKQIVFSAWDPGAKSDMQALADVFDTNHDGSLDAGDSDFNDFFVMVTNADGTQTPYSLASLGITSINLDANTRNVQLPDGSSITGETTFADSNGMTGTAASVNFAFDPESYSVSTTKTTNSDGSTTIANTALNADGSVAATRILNTSANGLARVLTNATPDSVQIQTDVVSGSTETVTNYEGGSYSATTGELTGTGVSGAEKLNSTATTTAAVNGGTQTTILRDQLGGGWTTQEEVQTLNADGSSSDVVSDLNPGGSPNNVTTTSVSADGLTRTTSSLVDGIAADSTTSVDHIVLNGSTKTETVTDSSGTTVTSLFSTVTQTAANSVTRATTEDLMDGTTTEVTSVAQTTTSSAGSTTTQTDTSAQNALLDETVTTNTPQSGGGLVTVVTKSQRDGFGNFIETGSETTTISNAGATATTTTVHDSANGTLRSESIATSTVGSAASSVTIYGNGDGKITQSQIVTVSGGTTTDTVENLNGDGSLANASVTVTSDGGLSKTIYVDSTGAGTAAAPVFDHITTDVTTLSGGNSTETVTDYAASISPSDEIDRTQTALTNNGLTKTVSTALTSASLASGTWDQITTDQTAVNSNGSLAETIATTDGHNNILETTTKTTSADRKTVISTTTLGTTNLVEQIETKTTQSNGAVQDQVVEFDSRGDVTGATVTTTSADGLVKTTQSDIQGQSQAVYASSGLAFDQTTTDTTVVNNDGSRTETINVTSRNGTLLSTDSVLTSANGLSITTKANPYGSADYATQRTDVTSVNLNASTVEVVSDYNHAGALIDRTATTVIAGGMAKTVLYDLDGDGVTDQSTTDFTTVNADGSQIEIVTDYTGTTTGTVRDITTTTSGNIVAGAGLETQITRQSNGSVPTYQVETIMPSANGTVTDTTKYYAQAGGPLLLQTTVTTSANGLVKTTGTAVNGDTSTDFSTTDSVALNPDGSQTETVANNNRSGLISETVTTTSANGLSKVTETDANGALNGSSPVFNLVTSDNTVLNSDGSHNETITTTAANGAAIEQTVTSTSADQQTIGTNRYLDETGSIGTVDQSETVQTQADGSVTDTVSSYNSSHNPIGTVVRSTSGNGQTTSTQYKNASGTATDTETDTTSEDANGDGGTIETYQDTDVVNGTNFTSQWTKQTAGNDQSTVTTCILAGALSATNVASFSSLTESGTVIADSGVATEITSDANNGASGPNDTTTIVTSANHLTTTTSTALGGANPYIIQQASVGLDGSDSQVTTYYNPASLSVMEEKITANTSADGRTITKTTMSDYDGTGYNTETDSYVENANGTTTETRVGSGSYNASAYKQTVTTVTNADSSLTTTTLNYDGAGVLIDQIVAETSPDGLVKTYAYDTNGDETIANLDAVAADLVNGAALPASMLGSDIIGSDVTTLNVDGSKTEVVETANGNSLANLRSRTTTLTSANGLVTTTFVDDNGNGVYERVATTTVEPDGSSVQVVKTYNDTSGTQQIDSLTVGATETGSNTYSVSADGLNTTLMTSNGITDSTVTFANANGSYEFAQSIAAGSQAASNGATNGSASHFIDANGIDTWSWNNGAGSSGTITIDSATEKQDVAIANMIYQAIFGRQMSEAETQYLARYISNGVLNRDELATNLLGSAEYLDIYYLGNSLSDGSIFDVQAALENALGRPPTAEEMATFGSYVPTHTEIPTDTLTFQSFAPVAVAIAQYAMDQADASANALSDPIFDENSLNTPVPVRNQAGLSASTTYFYSGYILGEGGGNPVNASLVGNNNLIYLVSGGLTISGSNNAVYIDQDAPAETEADLTASNTSVLIEPGTVAVITGDNDQIAEIFGPSYVVVTGNGDVINIAASAIQLTYVPGQGPHYTGSSITTVSNARVTVGAGVYPEYIDGNGDSVSIGAGSVVTVTGTGEAIDFTGGGSEVVLSSGIVTIEPGVVGDIISFQGSIANERIDVSHLTSVFSFADIGLSQVTIQGQPYLQVDLGGNQDIYLPGVTASQLSAANFIFQAPALSLQPSSGNAGNAIPLIIGTTYGGSLVITITGVPGAGVLSAGTHNSDGSWTLTPTQLTGLTLTMPAGSFAGTAALAVTATGVGGVSTSGSLNVAVAGVATAPTLSLQNVSGNAGSAIALNIASALTATDGTESLAIKITGIPGAASLSAGTLNSDGSWTLTASQLSGLTLTAPAGSFAGTASLTVTSTATESDGSAASNSAAMTVAIAGVASVPTLSVQNVSGNAGTAIALNIASALTATDGTESLAINIAGLPSGASLSAGTHNSDGSWTLTPSQLSELTLTTAANTPAQTANLTVTSTATESDGSAASNSKVLSAAIGSIYDVEDNLVSQTFKNAYGAEWVNNFDPENNASWMWTSSSYDANGNLILQTGTNDDGTHWLTMNDVYNSYSWSTATINFDAQWNETSITGTNHDGSHNVNTGSVNNAAFEDMTWYTTPYDPNWTSTTPVTLTGDSGNDILVGNAGNDTLVAGNGKDIFYGNGGSNTFVFGTGMAQDAIMDFQHNRDVVQFDPALFANYAAVLQDTSQVGANTVIQYDATHSLTLENVTASSLSASNFHFAAH
jgi:trimeric autotransporter adhesin